eukprot:TRINITY_DN95813_c0_g1_i1.p1 TRINITY_DN95813_c0_g1~~TRINITY_DN95813_c0_g1_i1.p1  ORF type:complete len:331 (+),score=36.43 TRINITY_DN95813_c0_g1_i1:70-1062(+)
MPKRPDPLTLSSVSVEQPCGTPSYEPVMKPVITNVKRVSLTSEISHAFVEIPEMPERQLAFNAAADELQRRNVPVKRFTADNRIQLFTSHPLSAQTFVMGTISSMDVAWSHLRTAAPQSVEYPECLSAHLHRKTWHMTASACKQMLAEKRTPVFVKPATRKLFTGMVVDSELVPDLALLQDDELLWCSEVVHWESEFRAFVLNGELMDVLCYRNDLDEEPDPDRKLYALDMDAVRNMVAALENDQQTQGAVKLLAYCFDVGVITKRDPNTNETVAVTALIEMGDGHSFGTYGLNPAVHVDMLLTNWIQVTKGQPAAKAPAEDWPSLPGSL